MRQEHKTVEINMAWMKFKNNNIETAKKLYNIVSYYVSSDEAKWGGVHFVAFRAYKMK